MDYSQEKKFDNAKDLIDWSRDEIIRLTEENELKDKEIDKLKGEIENLEEEIEDLNSSEEK